MNKQAMESFDYMAFTVEESMFSQYRDGYEKFGWMEDENRNAVKGRGKVTFYMKRDRHIKDKVELTRLQRHFESCMEEINTLENSKNTLPAMTSLITGLAGCAFMAGSVFAVTALHPLIALSVILAIPGFLLWAASYFGYGAVKRNRAAKVLPLVETKYDEAYEVCEDAYRLLI